MAASFSIVFGYIWRSFWRESSNATKNDFSCRVCMPRKREGPLYSGGRGRVARLFLAFVNSSPIQLAGGGVCGYQLFMSIWVHPDRLFAGVFQCHQNDFSCRVCMPRRREGLLYSGSKGEATHLFLAFGSSSHIQLACVCVWQPAFQ